LFLNKLPTITDGSQGFLLLLHLDKRVQWSAIYIYIYNNTISC
jgi:hypothetical protein